MEKQQVFRDYMEQQAQDFTDLQDYARASIDHLVHDAVTATRKYSGFNVTKTAQTEIQVAPGRFYDLLGAVYHRDTTLVQSMVAYLPVVSQRYIAVTVYGTESETDVEERDFLVDVDTGRTEPDAVATTSSRDAVLAIVTGTESADPQYPAIPVGSIAIAYVLLTSTAVSLVTMDATNAVESTEALDGRVDDLEEFNESIGATITSLKSQIADLQAQLKTRGSGYAISQLYEDMARVKERVEIPATAVDYGADRFLDQTDTDTDDTLELGNDCLVQEGCRFNWGNYNVITPLDMFSGNDENAHLPVPNGLLLPKYDNVKKVEIGPYHHSQGIGAFTNTTYSIVQKNIARQRLRYGEWFTVCTNAAWWQAGAYDQITQTFLLNGETYEVANIEHEQIENAGLTHWVRVRQVWRDNYVENYWDVLTTSHSVKGSLCAQTILIPTDMWLSKMAFYLTTKAANVPVYVTITKLTAGQPDLEKAIMHQEIPHTSLVVGDWTEFEVQPTYLKGGERIAVVLMSDSADEFGMTYGQNYVDGTFFQSTDGSYYFGDAYADLMLRLYGAAFKKPQCTIALTPLTLGGDGMTNIDILAGMIVPPGTQLIFEAQPMGTGAWIPLDETNLNAFITSPVLANFRARFAGSYDMQPAIKLNDSVVNLFAPKTTFTHVSEMQTLDGPSSEIHVKVLLENFSEVPHNMTCQLALGSPVGIVMLNPVYVETVTISEADKRYSREFKFEPTGISTFAIVMNGTTNSVDNTFHVAERIHWAL